MYSGVPVAYSQVSRLVDQTRVLLFDLITQYRAVFADTGAVGTGAEPQVEHEIGQPIRGTSAQGAPHENTFLQLWLYEKLSAFLQALEHALLESSGATLATSPGARFPQVDAQLEVLDPLEQLKRSAPRVRSLLPRLDALILQCMYFALSLARIGCDIRPQLHGLFERALSRCILHGLELAYLSYVILKYSINTRVLILYFKI